MGGEKRDVKNSPEGTAEDEYRAKVAARWRSSSSDSPCQESWPLSTSNREPGTGGL